jgi:signal transduction histidine kinase
MNTHAAKILVVDDEANVLFTTTSILRQEGYDVEGVGSGAEALRAIHEKHYDLVLTDLKMPGVDGLAVLAEVRKRSPSTVTVMITGYGSVDSALEAIQLGAYEYLLKPTEVADLKLAVKRSLERKRLSEIDTLYRINRALTRSLDLPTITSQVAEAVRNVLGVTGASVVCMDNGGPVQCKREISDLLADGSVSERLEAGEIITSEAALPAAIKWAQTAGIRDYALVPGIAKDVLACVLVVTHGDQPYEFHASATRFLEALASQTALAVENAALVAELKHHNQEISAANEKLRELDALKSKFLSIATHELRTPLSVILGYNSMLAESLQDRLSEEEKNTLEESVAACKRLIRLVNSMLDINQIQTGKMQMNFAREDLRPIVSGVVSLFQHEARQKQIHLGVEVPARLPKLDMDPERIQQVLINLVGNALKFTPAGGKIAILVRERRDGQSIEVAVQDSGIGIPLENQDKIFDEFAQIRAPGEHRREGSGLGLAIARRIVQAHQGSITVSSAVGKGSTFTVSLPMRTRQGTAITAMSA